MEVRTTTASSSNNLFENVEDRGIEIKCVNESHDANKLLDNNDSTEDDNSLVLRLMMMMMKKQPFRKKFQLEWMV